MFLGGGAHAPGATDIQEFLVSSIGADTIDDAVYGNTLVHKRVKKLLTDAGVVCGKGDEGGWAPQVTDARPLEIVSQAVGEVVGRAGFPRQAGPGRRGIRAVGREEKVYVYKDAKRTPAQQVDYIASLVDKYDLFYVEDPLQENDFDGSPSSPRRPVTGASSAATTSSSRTCAD